MAGSSFCSGTERGAHHGMVACCSCNVASRDVKGTTSSAMGATFTLMPDFRFLAFFLRGSDASLSASLTPELTPPLTVRFFPGALWSAFTSQTSDLVTTTAVVAATRTLVPSPWCCPFTTGLVPDTAGNASPKVSGEVPSAPKMWSTAASAVAAMDAWLAPFVLGTALPFTTAVFLLFGGGLLGAGLRLSWSAGSFVATADEADIRGDTTTRRRGTGAAMRKVGASASMLSGWSKQAWARRKQASRSSIRGCSEGRRCGIKIGPAELAVTNQDSVLKPYRNASRTR
mmetsp:Transcript_19721/g.47870  ORF Transcript_19721/g.47870 Transcript_19721/m.47870 type:complete len:286 (-) Transcript_19721:1337-2194(-)